MFDLGKEFPIPTQTSISDKATLLRLRELVAQGGSYTYFEIGSFMGGTLVPFLADPRCAKAYSVDNRGQVVGDERGAKYDYSAVTQDAMIARLQQEGVATSKLTAFDGDIAKFTPVAGVADLLFVDGEHTDQACFHDCVYARRCCKADSIIAFHDSSLVYNALRMLAELYASEGRKYRFCVVKDSEMSFLALGRYADDLPDHLNLEADNEVFFEASERKMLEAKAKHRLRLRPSLTGLRLVVRDAPVFKQRSGAWFSGPGVPHGVKIKE